jgi:DNA replication and repair protein RecF
LNYRNLGQVDLAFSPRINIFLGRNGQGKTNLLEGLSYPALGRSHRGARDRELIRFGEDHLHLRVEGEDRDGPFTVEVACTRDGRNRIKVDGRPLERKTDLVGRLTAVLFHPDEIDLSKGAPDHRRRFLDYTLSLISPDYFRHLVEYRRALSQKNRLLKERHAPVEDHLVVWDAELVRHGVPLIAERRRLLPPLEAAVQGAYSALAPRGGTLRMDLHPALGEEGRELGDEDASLEESFTRALRAGRARERALGFAQVGPHRDRLELRLRGRPLRRYGSQGEMRSAAIALKLGQADLLYERTRERPVVFLDDIFSELDRQRTEALQHRLHEEHQLFIATARADDVVAMRTWEAVRAWTVDAGAVSPLEDLDGLQHLIEEEDG